MPPPTTHLPCPHCGSSDALTDYHDHTYCFACTKTVRKEGLTFDQAYDTLDYNPCKGGQMEVTAIRGVTANTMRKYGVAAEINEMGIPVYLHYPWGGGRVKVRDLKQKAFKWISKGDVGLLEAKNPLFGMDKFPQGSGKYITITEGEHDAMSVYEMNGGYPAVSVDNAQSAVKSCKEAYKYLDSFERIYLSFDNDVPGQTALKEVAKLFNPNKVFIVQHGDGLKDANDYLMAGKAKEYTTLWWNAESFKPKSVINGNEQIKKIILKEDPPSIASYPFPSLEEKTFGIRTGEVNLFTAQEKVGKTEIFRAIEYHILKTTDWNIGVIHLEEPERRAILGLVNYELKKPVHLPNSGVSKQDQAAAYEKLTKVDNRVNFFSHSGNEDPDEMLSIIRYMVSVQGCKVVFLDHITWLVTGNEEGDERKSLDYMSTKLAQLAKELDFCLFLISHVNDDGKTRGSRNISKAADLIVYMTRDVENENDKERNTTNLVIKGNRFAGRTGPCTPLFFDTDTYTLEEKKPEDINVDIPF